MANARAWFVTALKPESITFFVAFLPQFLNPDVSFTTQVLVVEATFQVLAFSNALEYAIVASRARRIAGNARAMSWLNRTGGVVLTGAGLAAARPAHS